MLAHDEFPSSPHDYRAFGCAADGRGSPQLGRVHIRASDRYVPVEISRDPSSAPGGIAVRARYSPEAPSHALNATDAVVRRSRRSLGKPRPSWPPVVAGRVPAAVAAVRPAPGGGHVNVLVGASASIPRPRTGYERPAQPVEVRPLA